MFHMLVRPTTSVRSLEKKFNADFTQISPSCRSIVDHMKVSCVNFQVLKSWDSYLLYRLKDTSGMKQNGVQRRLVICIIDSHGSLSQTKVSSWKGAMINSTSVTSPRRIYSSYISLEMKFISKIHANIKTCFWFIYMT